MRMFKDHQKIRVVDNAHALFGKTGTVYRRCMADDGGWVKMDEDIPAEIASFPAKDSRRNHVRLYPDQCEPA